MEFRPSQSVTLADFIRSKQREVAGASGAFTDVLLSISLATKVVSRGVNRAGLASLLGFTGEVNVQGEAVQKLDVYADDVFTSILGRSGQFVSMVSEEQERVLLPNEGNRRSKYIIAFDPLDGSSNIDVNVSIGSIFGIYRRKSRGEIQEDATVGDFLQPGHAQVGAGYVVYGSSTMFVFTTGMGVNGFTLDPNIGEFILTHPEMKMPEDGSIYSCNEANSPMWEAPMQKFVAEMRENRVPGRKFSARYVGSLVADFHRTLLKGGVFLYPGDDKNPHGKLRLLYECAPLALIAEQACGMASDGKGRLLDRVPCDIHDRSPLIIGSKQLVDRLLDYVRI